MKVEAADPKVSGELLFPPADGIIGIVIRFESRLPRSMTLLARTKGRWKKKKNEAEKDTPVADAKLSTLAAAIWLDQVICNRQL